MDAKRNKSISKFLSLILRHKPETVGMVLDTNGWADVQELIQKCKEQGREFTLQELEEVVLTNDKQRFAFNTDHTKIRASQGHSVEVRLDLQPSQPPEYLYHGTIKEFLASIGSAGLSRMSRQHVHLSADLETARKVGSRKGTPIVLRICSGTMSASGHVFYMSENGVWLTDAVPPQFIEYNY